MFFVTIILLLSFPDMVHAHPHSGYSNEARIEQIQSSWMDWLNDDTKFSNLSIPGTHDTMSNGPGGIIVKNQAKSLNDQLYSGIRFLDIRTRVIDGNLAIHHGPVFLNKMFGDVLNDSIDFLKKNSSEVIFMRVKQEHSLEPLSTFISVLDTYYYAKKYSPYIYRNFSGKNPTLGNMRGKIVILKDYSDYGSIGLNYNDLNIQDNYHLNNNWDLYDKWIAIKKQLIKANNNYENETSYVNYLSGSGGSFPYFVASGHVTPSTTSNRLATGLTHPGWSHMYPDFPRTDWFLGMATIAFEGTNILTMDYINHNDLKYTGVILADFPGQGLINSIIQRNKFNLKPGFIATDFDLQLVPNLEEPIGSDSSVIPNVDITIPN